MSQAIDFWNLLNLVQQYIAGQYAAVLTDRQKLPQLKAYIEKYLRDMDYIVESLTFDELSRKLYSEMAEYSILTPFLGSPDLEEINVNGWDDIALTYLDGSIVKLQEHFHSPQHAVDIVKRLLHNSGMIIDNATPIAQGHLPSNTRITALKEPVVDAEKGIAVSIRLLHPQKITKEELIRTEFATEEMMDFLSVCLRYGVSMVIAGSTSTGKTTLQNCLLGTIPDNKRIFTIESGSRELSLVKTKDGKVINNVIHTLSRPSDNPAYDISQEKLVIASLRYNPDITCIGEIRDLEAYTAQEASLTGHTVISTVHASGCIGTHMRIALLCQKKYPIDFNTSLIQAAQAFPLVVFVHKLENNQRKIMEIAECEITPNGERIYRTLYNYNITMNEIQGNNYLIKGYFNKPYTLSESLRRRLMQYGIPQDVLNRILKERDE